MYKAKIRIWVFLLILSVIIFNFSEIITNIKLHFASTTYTVCTNIDESLIIPRINNYKKKHVELNVVKSKNDADIIIQDTSNEIIAGYTKYSEQLYSPIVAFVPYAAYSNDDTPFTVLHDGSYKYIQKDLKPILLGLLEDKTWEDVGMAEIMGKGNIKVVIPKEYIEGYEEIELLITYILNDMKPVDTIDPAIQKQVKNVLEKCTTYENASSYILSLVNAGKKAENAIVLAPEYIMTEDTDIAGTSQNSYSYMVCYMPKTVNIYYDLFIKEGDETATILNAFSSKYWLQTTGIRYKDFEFDISDATGFYYATSRVAAIN